MLAILLAQREFDQPGEVGPGALSDVPTIKGFEALYFNIASVVISFAGIAVFVLFLIGGFIYLTSSGNPEKVEAGKRTLTYALTGFLVILFALLILRLIQTFTGLPVTCFNVMFTGINSCP